MPHNPNVRVEARNSISRGFNDQVSFRVKTVISNHSDLNARDHRNIKVALAVCVRGFRLETLKVDRSPLDGSLGY